MWDCMVINPKWPHLGASPDGVVSCHGIGVIEVKCHKDGTIKNAATKDKTFCSMECDGELKLCWDHTHYYKQT